MFTPLNMTSTRFLDPEADRHGHRPLRTTADDYGRFLAHVLSIHDERWVPQVVIDDELGWGAGWGLELGPPTYGWQWGLDPGVSHFVIGSPDTGVGVVVLTDDPDGRSFYQDVVRRLLPGDHPSLRVEHNRPGSSSSPHPPRPRVGAEMATDTNPSRTRPTPGRPPRTGAGLCL